MAQLHGVAAALPIHPGMDEAALFPLRQTGSVPAAGWEQGTGAKPASRLAGFDHTSETGFQPLL